MALCLVRKLVCIIFKNFCLWKKITHKNFKTKRLDGDGHTNINIKQYTAIIWTTVNCWTSFLARGHKLYRWICRIIVIWLLKIGIWFEKDCTLFSHSIYVRLVDYLLRKSLLLSSDCKIGILFSFINKYFSLFNLDIHIDSSFFLGWRLGRWRNDEYCYIIH